ncbi:hypothetical protein NG798_11190 [Ancylothrix sp. C2]|uniref:hypothetical protein n=1 Tax=Ancylothrix sp. D3o TaxID=2953691 RepID=UPI0021BAA112|nr:hypothetical protein [Ancylothrix sp. D3o]MCT7950355.1 hypothetical protein [Ancylothrix sp. D3o]
MVKNSNNFNGNAEGYLPLIIPIAFGLVVILAAGRIFLPVAVAAGLGFGFRRYWQNKQKKLEELNSTFYQLIQENNGWVTALDLAMKSNVPGTEVQQYLDERAREFAAHYEITEQGGMIYYFETALSPNGSKPPTIVDTNYEPVVSFSEPIVSEVPKNPQPSSPPPVEKKPTESPPIDVPVSAVKKTESSAPVSDLNNNLKPASRKEVQLPPIQSKTEPLNLNNGKSEVSFNVPNSGSKKTSSVVPSSLTQSELAYRLGVHATTVSKWKMRPDFSEWSGSKDPAGVVWKYDVKSKRFYSGR